MLRHASILVILWACSVGILDVLYRRIPNVLSLGAWLVALVLLAINHASLLGADLRSTALAVGFALLVTLPAYVWRRLGAGDVKFLVAIGLLTSLPVTVTCFVMAALAGGAIAACWLLIEQVAPVMPPSFLTTQTRLGRWIGRPVNQRRMPYGTLMAIGLCAGLWMDNPT